MTSSDNSIQTAMSAVNWALLIALSLLWGGSFFFVEVIVDDWPTFTLVTLRVGLAAAALWIYIFARRVPVSFGREVWAAFFVMGLINNVVPFSLIAWGQIAIASGLASILNATTPLFTVLVAGFFLRDEAASARKVAGVGVGFLGVVVMVGPSALGGMSVDLAAQAAVLAAAFSYALAGVFGRRFRALGVSPVVVSAGQLGASTLILLPFALWFEGPDIRASFDAWIALGALGLFSTALAYVIYFRLLASAGAVNVLLVTFLVPVSAILLGALILGERLGLGHFLGMFLIGFGLSLIDGRLWRRPRSRSRS
ncbi:MAG: DMT family transporter [Alphaproteobacteria bacterium]|nr:DMT family transporter [Alphaproteobacteria bacterium]MDA7982620.1 DMT family transporter [Alphaproteobacteria bacterium]MDA7988182.1 DMT family transporter [Alphaproteobacteria bacterium]MDA8008985.1 DMT family transporter [Alphaproteobacteria bacterium]